MLQRPSLIFRNDVRVLTRGILTMLLVFVGTQSLVGVQSPVCQTLQRSSENPVATSTQGVHHELKSSAPLLPVQSVNSPIDWPSAPVSGAPSHSWVTSGREFYACFLAVVGSTETGISSQRRSLFITSRARTKVIVELLRSAYRDTVIVSPGVMARVDLPDCVGLRREDYEVALPNCVYIHSQEIISVYGYSHNYLSSDGFTIFPVEALGSNYVISTVRNAVNYLSINETNPRSEFGIVATEDNTIVTFKLKATSYSNRLKADSTYSITLNRGQVYQLMARDTGTHVTPDPRQHLRDGYYVPWVSGPDCDLTGSLVSSTKPIAVFAGHERASSPSVVEYDTAGGGRSRDHCIEQMPPVDIWGSRFIIASSEQSVYRPAQGDMVRVVAAYNNTLVKVNGVLFKTLAAGQVCEFQANGACYVESSQPSLVVKFMQSALRDNGKFGDPDMTVVRPTEAFSQYYSLPSTPDLSTYGNPRVLVVCDTSASIKLNDYPIPAAFRRIPGSAYSYAITNAGQGEQRVESTLPCYAETYGFAIEDSYTFGGGGDYKYVDSLYSHDLDYHAVVCGSASDLSTPLHSTGGVNPPHDTVLVYAYEWVSGDTSSFELLDGVPQPLRVTPFGHLDVPFRFSPKSPGQYSATLRVWSSAVNDVLIRLNGEGVQPGIRVTPDTINFGPVHIGNVSDSLFTIEDVGTSRLSLNNIKYLDYTVGTDFSAENLAGLNYPLDPGTSVLVHVHFFPFTEGIHKAVILVNSDDPSRNGKPDSVVLIGEGVRPKVSSVSQDFGSLRVDSISAQVSIPIFNRGSEASMLSAVEIVDSTDLQHFTITIDTFPPFKIKQFLLEPGSVHYFVAGFNPKSLGKKQVLVRITTTGPSGRDTISIIDTIRGEGVEPLITLSPKVIDYGTITVTKLNDPNPIALTRDMPFQVSNIGTMSGQLLKLEHTDNAHFSVQVEGKPDVNQALGVSNSLSGIATFKLVEEGDFTDTVYVRNDTRYALYANSSLSYDTSIILKGKVRTGPIDTAFVHFDTVTTCIPVDSDLVIHNPYPVTIHIDSLSFTNGIDTVTVRNVSDSSSLVGGFGFAGSLFNLPINIPPGGNYTLHLRYIFPDDSLNGTQDLSIILYQRRGGQSSPLQRLVTATVPRKERVLTLHALLPKFVHSATDIAPLKLPITMEGQRDDVPELDDWTLDLQFSNDLFQPDSVDNTGGLAKPKVPGGTPLTWSWDQSTRTFHIVAVGVDVSNQNLLANNLLLTVLMHAYLTTDTSVTVTPRFTFAKHPCAYNLEPFQLAIPYADECGEGTIRNYMLGNSPALDIIAISPNPVGAGTQDVRITYRSQVGAKLHCTVHDVAGKLLGELELGIGTGSGDFYLPASLFPASGTAFLTIDARDFTNSTVLLRKTSRISVKR